MSLPQRVRKVRTRTPVRDASGDAWGRGKLVEVWSPALQKSHVGRVRSRAADGRVEVIFDKSASVWIDLSQQTHQFIATPSDAGLSKSSTRAKVKTSGAAASIAAAAAAATTTPTPTRRTRGNAVRLLDAPPAKKTSTPMTTPTSAATAAGKQSTPSTKKKKQ